MWTRRHRPVLMIAYFVAAMLSQTCVNGQSPPMKRGVEDVSPDAKAQTTTSAYYALAIGINNYRYAPELKTAVNDANAIAQLLHDRYGFTAKVLHDATREEILTELNEYRRTLPENSNLLIYYAGHGHHDRDTDEAYWLPADARLDNNSDWISADDIARNVKAIPSQHIMIISDSCYSGALMRGTMAGINPREHQLYMTKLLKLKSRTIMASGGDEPVADGGGNGHSIFAQSILESLRQMDEGRFTAAEMFERFVQRKVAGKSSQLPHYSFIPQSGDDGGEFVFARKGAAEEESAAMERDTVSVVDTVAAQPYSLPSSGQIPAQDGFDRAVAAFKSQDYVSARSNAIQAANQGNIKSMVLIGLMEELGFGGEKNFSEAARWLRKAADAGDVTALESLAFLYGNGMGVSTDYAEAFRLYRMAADSGSASAMRSVGIMYEHGFGIQLNLAEAENWLSKASNAGDKPAAEELLRVQQLAGVQPPTSGNLNQRIQQTAEARNETPNQMAAAGTAAAAAQGQRFALVHYGGMDASQVCVGWMTIEGGFIRYQAVKGTHGMHNFNIPVASIKEAKRNGLLLTAYQAFHITLNTGENYNFSVFDSDNTRFMNPNVALAAIHAAMGR